MQFDERKNLNGNVEAAILFASYEPRCLRVAKHLAEAHFSGDVFVFYCEDIQSDSVLRNMAILDRLLKRPCRRIPVSYHRPEPMMRSARSFSARHSLLIDITCFNRENLFPFLWASRFGIDAFPAIQFCYTAPEKYGSWLSRDYHTPHNIVGFGGSFDSAPRRVLICLVGYEAKRALAVIETAEPSSVILALGSIPTRHEFNERNKAAVLEVLGSDRFKICEIDVRNPQKTLADLAGIVDSEDTVSSIHIAPFNTKISCLATYALWLERPQIRIWNALPETYNVRGYSKGDTEPRYFDISWNKAIRPGSTGAQPQVLSKTAHLA